MKIKHELRTTRRLGCRGVVRYGWKAGAALASQNAVEMAWAGPVGWMAAADDSPRPPNRRFDIDSYLWPFDAGKGLDSFQKAAANQSEWSLRA